MSDHPINVGSQVLLWVGLVAVAIWLIYSATHSSTENNKFAAGAESHDNHSTRWPFTIDLNFSCVPKEFLRADKSNVDFKSISTNAVRIPVKN